MPLTQINYTLPITNRIQMRKDVINLFSAELPGTGTGNNASRYEYTVEQYQTYSVVLKRPANLNKGFDFTVNVVGLKFRKKKCYQNPSHNDIIAALSYCKSNNQNYNNVIIPIIRDIFNCRNVNLGNSGFTFVDYLGQSHPIEIILLALKWLFIEQDFTYWNNSGRYMLFNILHSQNLA